MIVQGDSTIIDYHPFDQGLTFCIVQFTLKKAVVQIIEALSLSSNYCYMLLYSFTEVGIGFMNNGPYYFQFLLLWLSPLHRDILFSGSSI